MFDKRRLLLTPYAINSSLIDTSIAGTYQITIRPGRYQVTLVGAGGGGVGCAHGGVWYYAAGGGGACFKGILQITYSGAVTVTVGAGGISAFNASSASGDGAVSGGSSTISNILTAGGGEKGSGTNASTPGTGGIIGSFSNSRVISSVIYSNGNNAVGGS